MIVRQYNPYGATHQVPRLIVIHAMGEYVSVGNGEFEYAPEFLLRQGLSAHALVAPNGTIYRCRQDSEGAYHAQGHNSDSLGIEIMVAGKHDYGSFLQTIKMPYLTEPQYAALLAQCQEWYNAHHINTVVRHSDISPGRKYDPGAGFPMARLLSDLGRSIT